MVHKITNQPVSDEDLHLLVDNRLDAAKRIEIQARLELEPQVKAKTELWRKQRDSLQSMHSQVLQEPIPAVLIAAAQNSSESRLSGDQWWRWGGIAAAIMMAFGVGWLSHGQWLQQQPMSGQAETVATQKFVRQASFAHNVYTPEVRHPVEVTAADQEHLVQWLSKRVGRPLRVPNLSSEGFELVGGRLLPGEASTRAQFMFQNTSGIRITMYLGVVDISTGNSSANDTVFSFSNEGSLPSFYWMDKGFGYALSGNLPREKLMKLARVAYEQI